MPCTYTFHRQAMLNRTTRILRPIAFRTRFHGETMKMLWLKRSCYDLKRSQRFHAKTSPLQWLKTKCYDLTLPLVCDINYIMWEALDANIAPIKPWWWNADGKHGIGCTTWIRYLHLLISHIYIYMYITYIVILSCRWCSVNDIDIAERYYYHVLY